MLGGVAAGIAQHLGVSRLAVRLFFVLSVLAAGFGLVCYILLWILTPRDEGGMTVSAAPRRLRWPGGAQLAGVGLVVIGTAVLLAIGGFWFGDAQGWPIVLAAICLAVLWARSGD